MSGTTEIIKFNSTRLELLTEVDQRFIGVGRVWIGDTLVRSGRLPWSVFSQSFTGCEISDLFLDRVEQGNDRVVVHLRATFSPMPVKLMRDHSFDLIYELGDWDQPAHAGSATLRLVIEPAEANYDGIDFEGFRYSIEYGSEEIPIFHLLERGSWELDGRIEGVTVYNQSACSPPVVTFSQDTFWSTEGFLRKLDPAEHFNRCMTHNLPRWCDHQWFDFQFRGEQALIGVYDRVDLIRSVLCRDPGKDELKHFDKHIFDEALSYATSPRAILLSRTPVNSVVKMKNMWTRIYEQTADAARLEFGLNENRPGTRVSHHYWQNYTIDTYYKDIVPASVAIGVSHIFAENFKRSDASEPAPLPAGNMCCSHEYEIAESKGGMKKFEDYIQTCKAHGIENYMWTNTYVSLAAKLNALERGSDWFMSMEDTRLKYGGAYTSVSSNLNLKDPETRQYWVDAHRKIAEESGLEGYFIDSHYNLFFMPVNYKGGHPQTVWRESLEVMKTLQDDGVRWMIESFGPFGAVLHGHDRGYSIEHAFICIDVGLGNGAVTVPVPGLETNKNESHDPAFIFYALAHRMPWGIPLFIDGKRADDVYGEEHRRVIRLFKQVVNEMDIRYLQEDNLGVLYHNKAGDRALLWNFEDRVVDLSGMIVDIENGDSPKHNQDGYELKARHVYALTSGEGHMLPVELNTSTQFVVHDELPGERYRSCLRDLALAELENLDAVEGWIAKHPDTLGNPCHRILGHLGECWPAADFSAGIFEPKRRSLQYLANDFDPDLP